MANILAFNRFISVSALVACLVSLYLAIEIKSGGIDLRNLMRESWPLPRFVTLHDVGVFGPDTHMYKYYTGVADVPAFASKLYETGKIDDANMNTIKLMKYASGCYRSDEYVKVVDKIPLLPQYEANYTLEESQTPGRSVCKCLDNIDRVVKSSLQLNTIKSEFNTWLGAFGDANNNYVVMTASDSLTEATSAAYTDLQDQAGIFHQMAKDDKTKFVEKAAERCFLSSQPQYVIKYSGQLDTKVVMFNGIILLIFAVFASVFKFPSEQPAADKTDSKEYLMLWSVSLCYYVYFILALIWTFNKDLRDHVFGSTIPSFADATDVTDNHTSYIEPINYVQIFYDTIFLIVLAVMSFLFASQQLEQTLPTNSQSKLVGFFRKVGEQTSLYLPNADNLIWKCVQNDLPYIIGYASIGLALLVANGLTATKSVMFAFTILISIGFLQHISNVNKIVYDALCQNTDSTSMAKLTQPTQDGATRAMRTNLMFFGWTRVLWFLVVFLLTVTLLTFTRADADHNEFSGFLNSHVFWFVIALFWANVGYDVLRELLPFQFESTPPNQHKVIITATYVLYLCWSMSQLMQQIAHNNGSRHLYAD